MISFFKIITLIIRKVLFLLSKFYLDKRSVSEIIKEGDAEMYRKYYDPIEHFPDKIDELLDIFNRGMCFAYYYY